MEDLGQIISVVLAVAFFIYSTTRKKKAKGAGVQQQQASKNKVESFFNTLEGVAEEVVTPGFVSLLDDDEVESDYEVVEKTRQEPVKVVTPKAAREKVPEEGISAVKHHMPKPKNAKNTPHTKRSKQGFNLRQAVIYNEILNRKY